MPSPIIGFALRGAQALFAIIVIGLSVSLMKGQYFKDKMPSTFGFSIFVGSISLVGAAIGIAATWIDLLQTIIGVVIDVVIILINLAGGVLIAIKLKGVDCMKTGVEERYKMENINLINGGCHKIDGLELCGYTLLGDDPGKLNSRCKMNQADSAFMFLTIIVLLATATITFLNLKKR